MDVDVLLIKLADGQCDGVDRAAAGAFSSCARGLPQDAEIWDISHFKLEGQPVQRETVVAWLNLAYRFVHGSAFEEQLTNPAGSATGLVQLLSFADAVGSTRGMLQALDADATALTKEVKLKGKQSLTLELSMGNSHSFKVSTSTQLDIWTVKGDEPVSSVTLRGPKDKAALQQFFAGQVEALLHLAYKLQLPVLKESLHKVILRNSYHYSPLLDAKAMDSIVSERVLAACDQQTSKPAMINSLTTQLLVGGNNSCKWHCIIQPEDKPIISEDSNALRYNTLLKEDFLCYRKGETLEVFMLLFPSSGRNDNGSRVYVKRKGNAEEWRTLNVELHLVPFAGSTTCQKVRTGT